MAASGWQLCWRKIMKGISLTCAALAASILLTVGQPTRATDVTPCGHERIEGVVSAVDLVAQRLVVDDAIIQISDETKIHGTQNKADLVDIRVGQTIVAIGTTKDGVLAAARLKVKPGKGHPECGESCGFGKGPCAKTPRRSSVDDVRANPSCRGGCDHCPNQCAKAERPCDGNCPGGCTCSAANCHCGGDCRFAKGGSSCGSDCPYSKGKCSCQEDCRCSEGKRPCKGDCHGDCTCSAAKCQCGGDCRFAKGGSSCDSDCPYSKGKCSCEGDCRCSEGIRPCKGNCHDDCASSAAKCHCGGKGKCHRHGAARRSRG